MKKNKGNRKTGWLFSLLRAGRSFPEKSPSRAVRCARVEQATAVGHSSQFAKGDRKSFPGKINPSNETGDSVENLTNFVL